MAARILNSTLTPSFRPSITRYQQANGRASSLRLSAQSSETPFAASSTYTSSSEGPTTSVPSFSPPPNFKPPQPKPFSVRPDKLLDILAGSLAFIFRLGTGAVIFGYSASFVPKNEILSDKYALEIAGFNVKATSKLVPRPEKPIEIYEFERSEKLFQSWILMLYTIPVHEMALIFIPRWLRWMERNSFPTWLIQIRELRCMSQMQ